MSNLTDWSRALNDLLNESRDKRSYAQTTFINLLGEDYTIPQKLSDCIDLVLERTDLMHHCGPGGCNQDDEYAAIAANRIKEIATLLLDSLKP